MCSMRATSAGVALDLGSLSRPSPVFPLPFRVTLERASHLRNSQHSTVSPALVGVGPFGEFQYSPSKVISKHLWLASLTRALRPARPVAGPRAQKFRT